MILYGKDMRSDIPRRVHVDDIEADYSFKEFLIRCEGCGARLVPKRGEKRQHHFAHRFVGEPDDFQKLCKERYERSRGSGPSEWHKKWQSVFPQEYREVIMANAERTDSRRGDIVFQDRQYLIEFQKGEFGMRFKKDTCKDRNDFWNWEKASGTRKR